MKKNILIALICLTSGCRTLDPSAVNVNVADRAGENCKNLGVVNIDWAWWGVSSESLNVMRNQVAAKGGNLLVPTGDGNMGIAYACPSEQ